MDIKIFKEYNDILKILKEFDDCFPHLKEKVDDYEEFALKLSKFANIITIQKDQENVAMCVFYANDKVTQIGYISLIGVKDSFRGYNFGKLILLETIKLMKEKDMKKLKLEVDTDNLNAIGFYKHMGFTECGKAGNESFYLELNI